MNQKGLRKNYIRIGIIGGALLCFAYLACLVTVGNPKPFDDAVRYWAYGHRGPMLNTILITITYLGNWQSITLLGLGLLFFSKTRKDIGLPFAVVSLSSTVLYKLVKSAFARPRPELSVRLIEQGGFSFPSGHSMNGIVCFGILIYLIRRYCKNKRLANLLTVLLGLLIFMIGLSRVYVGVHYPTDILAGWSLGAAYLTISIIILEKIGGKSHDLQ